MSVAPIGKLKSNGFFNQSSTSIVVSKESGVTFVLPDGVELPERFEYVESEKYILRFKTPTQKSLSCNSEKMYVY